MRLLKMIPSIKQKKKRQKEKNEKKQKTGKKEKKEKNTTKIKPDGGDHFKVRKDNSWSPLKGASSKEHFNP